MEFKGFHSPEFTQTPNDLFDELLSQIDSMAELKVILVAIRKMYGWHKAQDRISISQFMEATGLCRESVINGLAACVKRGTLERIGRDHHNQSMAYRLVVIEQSEAQPLTETADSSGLQNRPLAVYQADHPQSTKPTTSGLDSRHTKETKETLNKTKETNIAPKAEPLTPFQQTWLSAWQMKRFPTMAQKDAIAQLEKDVGYAICDNALKWATKNNIRTFSSFETACRNGKNRNKASANGRKPTATHKAGEDVRDTEELIAALERVGTENRQSGQDYLDSS